jgi:hypothetical protein
VDKQTEIASARRGYPPWRVVSMKNSGEIVKNMQKALENRLYFVLLQIEDNY